MLTPSANDPHRKEELKRKKEDPLSFGADVDEPSNPINVNDHNHSAAKQSGDGKSAGVDKPQQPVDETVVEGKTFDQWTSKTIKARLGKLGVEFGARDNKTTLFNALKSKLAESSETHSEDEGKGNE